MPVGMSATTANNFLNALFRNVSYTNAAVWVKLHVADPGAAGTTSPAVETTRQQGTFGTAASGGSIANTAALTWTSIAGSEDATHFTAWTANVAGTFLGSGTITANPYTAGDTYTVAIGAATFSLAIAS